MFGFGSAKMIVGGLAILAISLTIYAGYKYVVNLQEDNARLTGEVTKLEIAVEIKDKTINQVKTDLLTNEKNQKVLNEELAAARKDKDEIIKLFGDHDFAKLVAKKPGLIEKKINTATKKVLKEIENVTQ